MTKLTKEQIEQERVKFIAFYCVDFSSELAYEYNNKLQQFSSPFIDSKYRGWLARAELDKGE